MKTKRPVATAPAPPVPQRKPAKPKAPRTAVHHADLERPRRLLAEIEAGEPAGPDDRLLSSARTGADELRQMLEAHTEASPALTAGDVDAKWDDAYAVGDEAPGGDNPTPGQDRVDDIGKALGVSYEDNEELIGSEKIIERDRHRWELDPASSDDWPHNKDQ